MRRSGTPWRARPTSAQSGHASQPGKPHRAAAWAVRCSTAAAAARHEPAGNLSASPAPKAPASRAQSSVTKHRRGLKRRRSRQGEREPGAHRGRLPPTRPSSPRRCTALRARKARRPSPPLPARHASLLPSCHPRASLGTRASRFPALSRAFPRFPALSRAFPRRAASRVSPSRLRALPASRVQLMRRTQVDDTEKVMVEATHCAGHTRLAAAARRATAASRSHSASGAWRACARTSTREAGRVGGCRAAVQFIVQFFV